MVFPHRECRIASAGMGDVEGKLRVWEEESQQSAGKEGAAPARMARK